MKQKIAMALVTLSLLLTLGTAQAFAGNEALAHAADLHVDQQIVYSKTCEGTYKIGWGRNSSTSKHRVWFVIETKSSSGDWVEDQSVRKLLYAGESFGETSSYRYGNSHTWRMKVDAYAWNWDCTATGYIRNK